MGVLFIFLTVTVFQLYNLAGFMNTEHCWLCIRLIFVEAKDMDSNACVQLACPKGSSTLFWWLIRVGSAGPS